MLNKKNRLNAIEANSTAAATTTDSIPEGVNNLYLTTNGGGTDNLATMPNFNILSSTLNSHLSNSNNPHSQILAGLRSHQTQVTLTQNITLDNTNYVDCLLVQSSSSTAYNITIPNELTVGYAFAIHAAFTAFRLGAGALTVTAASGVSFVNITGSVVTLSSPGTSYYLFIKQATNQWAVITYTAATSTTTLTGDVTGSGIGTIPTTLATLSPNPSGSFGSATQVATFTVNGKGQITAASNVAISGGPPSGAAGGDLSGTYPNPTVAQINTVPLGTTTATAGNLLIGSGTAWVTHPITGDVTITSVGATAIGAGKITHTMVANNAIDLTTQVTNVLPAANGGTGVNNSTFTLTLGGNVSTAGSFTTSGANPITLTTTGTTSLTLPLSGTLVAFTWNEVTTTSQAMAPNSGYITNNAATVMLTLPTSVPQGSIIKIVGKGSGGWQIEQNSLPSQVIYFGNETTTAGANGYLASTNQRDSITLLCTTANTEFTVIEGPMGNITYF